MPAGNKTVGGVAQANRDVSTAKPGALQDCHDVVHIAVFFDGTGNNKDADNERHKWSNVARMFDTTEEDRKKAIYSIYLSGVGTRFNGLITEEERKWADFQDGELTGAGTGMGGQRRIDYGGEELDDRLREVFIKEVEAKGIKEAEEYVARNSDQSFSQLQKALGHHRLIRQINVSIFGFSRGAAQARAFANTLVNDCEKEGEGLTYEGVPFRISFLGVFDTVASFGLPASNVELPWQERRLVVPKEVERCVHFVAAHEIRFSFPVDLIRQDGKLDRTEWEETVYPGVHSDVGGGYLPTPEDLQGIGPAGNTLIQRSQEKSWRLDSQDIRNAYARIPMADMMDRAINRGGTKLQSFAALEKKSESFFMARFHCPEEVKKTYRSYMAIARSSGTVEEQMHKHKQLYYSVWGTVKRNGGKLVDERMRALNPEIGKRVPTLAQEMELAIEMRNAYASNDDESYIVDKAGDAITWARYVLPAMIPGLGGDDKYTNIPLLDFEKRIRQTLVHPDYLNAWESPAPQAAIDFIQTFVHDSKVGFLEANVDITSYLRPRGVKESDGSIFAYWQAVFRWVGDVREDTYDYAVIGMAKAKQNLEEAWDATKETATEVWDATKEAAEDAAEWVADKANQAADWVSDTANDITENIAGAARVFGKKIGSFLKGDWGW